MLVIIRKIVFIANVNIVSDIYFENDRHFGSI
jgi:hypothetical protein